MKTPKNTNQKGNQVKTTMTNLRRIIRKTITEAVASQNYVNLLYTIRPVGKKFGKKKERNKMYSLDLSPGEELTPEKLVDFWYEQNSFYGNKTETHVPIAAQALETQGTEFGEDGHPVKYGARVPVGPVYDLEPVIEKRNQQ